MLFLPAARFGITTVSTIGGAGAACAASATCVESGAWAAAGIATANSSSAAIPAAMRPFAPAFSLRSYMVGSFLIVAAGFRPRVGGDQEQAVMHRHAVAHLEGA